MVYGQPSYTRVDSGSLAVTQSAGSWIGRPYLEFTALANLAAAEYYESVTPSVEHARGAVELAKRHGWTDDPAFGVACMVLGAALIWQGQLDEAEPWVERAERIIRADTHPVPALSIRGTRGLLEFARRHDTAALATFQSIERLSQRLAVPHHTVPAAQGMLVHILVRLGETERAGQILAGLSEQDRERAETRVAASALRLAQDEPRAALAVLAPVLDGRVPSTWRMWLVLGHTLEAIAQDTLGDQAAAESALERALDLAEPNADLTPFLLYPARVLLERHAGHHTAHASLLVEIRGLLAGQAPAPPAGPRPPLEPLSDSEIRVLRYLPTNLSMRQIAGELYVSHNTVRTHIRHLYEKLGTHTRAEAVDRARALGLLAPSPLRVQAARPG